MGRFSRFFGGGGLTSGVGFSFLGKGHGLK
jgi:hypothetical protein